MERKETMMKTKILVGLLAMVGVALVASSAHANPTNKDNSYGYVFDDDALRAEGQSANTAQITVLKSARRERLVRPRVHFVTEMLKSVENM
jgi:hypothetical protein